MIEDIEWREVEVKISSGVVMLAKELWAYDGHVWFKVPTKSGGENEAK